MYMNFATMFPETKNVHLVKDVGMIAYIMYRKYGFNSKIICYNNGEYPYLNKEVKGLEIGFIKRYTGNSIIDGSIYLIFNSHNIDVLHLFHFNKRTVIYTYIYKIFNRRGKIYLKLDADNKIKKAMTPYSKGIKTKMKKLILKKYSLISVETSKIYNYLKDNWISNIKYIPNGFYDYDDKTLVNYEEKENIICTVGRIGTYQKATNILLEGFKLAEDKIGNWKLKIIGPIESDFRNYIDEFYINNPNLKDKIIFTGPIYDRNKLNEEYKKSKIFCLTSRFESFGLVFLEAMKNGCYLITSDIESSLDVTDNKKYGNIFPIDDVKELANCLVTACNNENSLYENCKNIQEYVYKKFYWPVICKKVNNLLKYDDY